MTPEQQRCETGIALIETMSAADAAQFRAKLTRLLGQMHDAESGVLPWTRGEWIAHYRRQLAQLADEIERWPMDGSIAKRGRKSH